MPSIDRPPPSRARKRDRGHEIPWLHAQRPRQALDGLQPHRALAALDQADVGPVQPGRVGQGLLRETAREARLADALTESGRESGGRHG